MNIVIGLLGPVLDFGRGEKRWKKWRPSVSICQHADFQVDQFDLLFQDQFGRLASHIKSDISAVSEHTTVNTHKVDMPDPWGFESVYASLHDFAESYEFDTDKHNYFVHITTGTHVAQICMFLLTESRLFPAKLLQSSPPQDKKTGQATYSIIDLDLSKYDRIARRFARKSVEGRSFLKSGIDTKNRAFNNMIAEIEEVSIKSKSPILLSGATGVGKTQLARKIYELKKQRHQIDGPFVEMNCATLRGDTAMSMLFGHKKGAFTGAATDRSGLLKQANNGMLFLDEIGELGADEQAMLLRAIEDKRYLPVGADQEVTSNFQLIAGTNKDLQEDVTNGLFREDLLARINLWCFTLPGLADRKEDIAANLEFELDRFATNDGQHVTINAEAKKHFMQFAHSSEATWRGNFRDLSASVTRMATLAPGGRINKATAEREITRLKHSWQASSSTASFDIVTYYLGEQTSDIDRFDRVQLEEVLHTCQHSRSMAEAGRVLFAESRKRKTKTNDSDRLKKYLAKFGLVYEQIV